MRAFGVESNAHFLNEPCIWSKSCVMILLKTISMNLFAMAVS